MKKFIALLLSVGILLNTGITAEGRTSIYSYAERPTNEEVKEACDDLINMCNEETKENMYMTYIGENDSQGIFVVFCFNLVRYTTGIEKNPEFTAGIDEINEYLTQYMRDAFPNAKQVYVSSIVKCPGFDEPLYRTTVMEMTY